MKTKATIEGVPRLNKQLRKLAGKARGGAVEVGYTAAYAIYVHEMVGANFKRPGSQAKFLEQPYRENWVRYVGIIRKTLDSGGAFMSGLLLAALSLQRDSQKLCPVDTGNLRASAYTRKIEDE